ncbi:MAG: ATP-dependent DNA helicase RecG [Candidatus Omnitrophota bacterium]
MKNKSIQYFKGIGLKRAKAFSAYGINTIEELMYYFPRRYEDRTNFVSIAELKAGQVYTIKGKILANDQRNSWRRRKFSITETVLCDSTGRINCVWFNQPYLFEYLKTEATLILFGRVQVYQGKLQMSNPEFEFVSNEDEHSLNIGRIVPVYTLPPGFSQRTLRKLMKNALDEFLPEVNDCLPFDLRIRNNLLNLAQSLLNIHFPGDFNLQKQAHNRLSFEDFFIFQLPLVLRKLKRREKKGIKQTIDGKLVEDFILALPFKLTSAQEMVLGEIKADMASAQVMQRLLQGDVGSGKTVVATLACLMAIQGGYQAAFMAPTEILARQHYESIVSQTSGLVSASGRVRVGLLVGQDQNRMKIYRDIQAGNIDLVIGTHALLQERLSFKNLGFVVIDEQHKFGVGQRALLPKKGRNPDVLIMTATPIPRTLAITLYGDLDISVINQLPPGRKPIETLHFTPEDKQKGYRILKQELNYARQGYIVYPVIEESSAWDIAGAKKMFLELKEGEFKNFRLGLIHGQLKQKEQEEVMLKFKNKELNLLLSTTVLEVGIDIANATCMIIEHAERFGLSQLHQLRGRIGRGAQKSFCILISDAPSQEAKARLVAMVASSDGFRIAEQDLKIRGPGEFFGKLQHGLAKLKIANPLIQMQLLKAARVEAFKLLKQDLSLEDHAHKLLKEKLLQKFPEYEKLILVG